MFASKYIVNEYPVTIPHKYTLNKNKQSYFSFRTSLEKEILEGFNNSVMFVV